MTRSIHFHNSIKANLVWALILIAVGGNAQSKYNLVPNYSFETYTFCPPNGGDNIALAPPWITANNAGTQCEYANACSNNSCCSVPFNVFGEGYQYAHTGNGYACFYFMGPYGSNFRSYAQVKLLDSLRMGFCYYVEFYVNFANCYQLACNNISLLLGDTAVSLTSNGLYIPASPQILQYGNPVIRDTLNWAKVAGIYTAHGGERYITIGNFMDDAHTDTIQFQANAKTEAGYYVDDVSVIPLDSMVLNADAGRDTTIAAGDSVWVGTLLCGLTTQWHDASGNNIATNVPGLWVKPTTNTYYILQQNECGQASADTVYITVTPMPVTLVSFDVQPLTPSPSAIPYPNYFHLIMA